jgi:hypothetical protein
MAALDGSSLPHAASPAPSSPASPSPLGGVGVAVPPPLLSDGGVDKLGCSAALLLSHATVPLLPEAEEPKDGDGGRGGGRRWVGPRAPPEAKLCPAPLPLPNGERGGGGARGRLPEAAQPKSGAVVGGAAEVRCVAGGAPLHRPHRRHFLSSASSLSSTLRWRAAATATQVGPLRGVAHALGSAGFGASGGTKGGLVGATAPPITLKKL